MKILNLAFGKDRICPYCGLKKIIKTKRISFFLREYECSNSECKGTFRGVKIGKKNLRISFP